ncbi:MAG: hypothetical protein HY508_04810 [Acidobacteria bacterium]|nr:hypothetical protein [Acidobacteriota bacterium]
MKKGSLLAAAALFLLVPAASHAQIFAGPSNVTLNASLAESLSVSLTGVSTVNFTLAAGAAAAGDSSVGIQTGWVLKPGKTHVKLVGYFDTTNALTDPGPPSASIETQYVFGRVTTGSPTVFTAFTQGPTDGVGIASASLLLFDESITGINKNKTRTDDLDLQIDLTTNLQQPAGDYTGVLHIRAVAL